MTEDFAGLPSGDFVRPFVITGGRTRPPDRRLQVETVVAATGERGEVELAFESASILELCSYPLSIAELGARLRLPVGVVRVLVGDLVAEGLLTVHYTDPVEIELSTLRRMIDRVRAL